MLPTRRKILDLPAALSLRGRLRAEGRTLVFTNGCYDILHPGHVRFLEEARALGDALLVALNTDASVRRNKSPRGPGPPRPIVPEAERAEVVAALRAVDAVTFFAEDTPDEIIAALVPDVLVKGADWGEDAIVGRETVEAAGGRVVRLALLPGFSTSAIVEAARTGSGPLRAG